MTIQFLYPILPQRLFFVHVPKCAGTSLIDLLDSMYVQNEIFPNHYDVPRLEQTPPDEVRPYRFYRGHLPSYLLIEKVGEPLTMITVLRDPVSRLISNFEMRQRVPDPLDGLQPTLAQLTLEKFLEHPVYFGKFAHRATELIGKIEIVDGKRVPDVELALEQLRAYEVVGLMERFEDTLQLLTWKFRWPPIRYSRRKNVSPNRERRAGISEKVKARIRELEWADMRLYGEAQRLFEKAWSAMWAERWSAGPDGWRHWVLEPHLRGKESSTTMAFYDFRRVYPGQGWYGAEPHPRYGVIRWSGPERESFVFAYVQPLRPLRLQVHIVNWLAEDTLRGLEILVNGAPLESANMLRIDDHEALIQANIPPSFLATDGLQEIGFRVPSTFSPKELGIGSDERLLGLCYHSLMLTAG